LADICCVALAERGSKYAGPLGRNCRIRWVRLCKYLRVGDVYLQA
jgi:hypothetical protein